MSYSKGETTAFNVDDAIKNQKSLNNIGNNKIENVKTLCILGTRLQTTKKKHLASCMQGLGLPYRSGTNRPTNKIVNTGSFSDDMHAVAPPIQHSGLVTWKELDRKMVKGGYARKNVPIAKNRQVMMDEDLDWRYEISNEKIREITQTLPIRNFCYRQHVK